MAEAQRKLAQRILGRATLGENEETGGKPGPVGAWGWRLDALPSADVAERLRAASEEAGRLARPAT